MNAPSDASFLYAQIPYRDAPAALRWLERAFGLETTAEWPDDDGGIQHAEMRRGNAVFTVFTDRAGYDRPHARGESVGFGLVFALGSPVDVDETFRSAVDAGAVVVFEPTDTEWGNYRCRVRDLEGYEWTFGTYKPGEPQEWTDADDLD
ncbi:VOC family protein [Microbacterium sp. C23T]